ncbi:MAG: hypothetical protein WHS77_08070 [Brevinematales bacterium]
MLSLKAKEFDENHLFFHLEEKQYLDLKDKGNVIIKENFEKVQDDDLCLVCYWPEWLDLTDDSTNSFSWLIKNTFVASIFIKENELVLKKVADKPLFDLVNEEFDKMPHNETFFDRKKYDIRKIYVTKGHYEYGFFNANKKTKDFLGLLSGCSCGYLECACDFAYIKDYELLIYAKSEGGGIFHISFFPKYLRKVRKNGS